MDYEALMDGRQKHVHEHFSPNSKLNDPEFVKKLLDWITFWRRNPSRFVQRYFGITLYLYQHIILYLMDIFPSICIVAARSAAKSFIIAVYACKKAGEIDRIRKNRQRDFAKISVASTGD